MKLCIIILGMHLRRTRTIQVFADHPDEFVTTYERRGVVGTEAGVDGPGFSVLAQKLRVI